MVLSRVTACYLQGLTIVAPFEAVTSVPEESRGSRGPGILEDLLSLVSGLYRNWALLFFERRKIQPFASFQPFELTSNRLRQLRLKIEECVFGVGLTVMFTGCRLFSHC